MKTDQPWMHHEAGKEPVVINASDISTEIVASSIAETHPEIATMLRWGQQVRSQRGGLFERDMFVTPQHLFDQMRVAQDAAELDDVVSGVLETTEALALSRMSVECEDEDQEDIWNQIAEDIDLDCRIREMWREMFIVSQCYVAVWWDIKDYKVRGRSKTGVQRKKTFNGLKVPTNITLLDPMKVIPVGNFMFNQEKLAWIATREECTFYDNVLSGKEQDETVSALMMGHYQADKRELTRLGKLGVDPNRLFLLNPDLVWRLTATRPQYKPFADVRMKSVFELLDLKHLLRELDRSLLLGATNFIVLIRKGTDNMPAKNTELQQLQSQVRTLSQVPVIVGDHRLEIEIITPKIDLTLVPEKYNTLDARITARLYQMFMTGNYAAGAKGDDSVKLVRIVARGLEARRSSIKDAIQDQILDLVYDRNDSLTEEPCLRFHPKTVAIDFDPAEKLFYLDLRDRKEISRATILEQVDLDEDEEARKLEREAEVFDDTFKTLTPLQDPQQVQDFSLETLDKEQQFQQKMADDAAAKAEKIAKLAPKVQPGPPNADPKSAGRAGGGNRGRGGAAPGSGQGQEKDPRRKAKG